MSIKIGIIGTNGLPGKYGGWDQLVNHITRNLRNDFSFIVYTSYKTADPKLKECNGAKLKIIRFKANGIQSIPFDIVSMLHAVINCDVLFICGTSGCITLPFMRLFGKKIVLNPDGQEWKRKKWSKPVQWFLKISERFGVHFASTVVADNVKIQEYILEKYNKESSLIEYGGDQVINVDLSIETANKYTISKGNYAFKVCRIEPENNIHVILEAFKEKGNIDLIIIGNWDFSEYGRSLRNEYSRFENLKLLNPIYDQVTLDELRSNCGLYVHGHSVGGTNPSLVEAMNLGLCIAAYNVDYNIETTENSALYFSDEKELLKILYDFENDLIDIEKYKGKMKEIALRRYRWSIITEKYAKVFDKKKSL
jgi:glycosyltransferase involved in cell wall biosynthesis